MIHVLFEGIHDNHGGNAFYDIVIEGELKEELYGLVCSEWEKI